MSFLHEVRTGSVKLNPTVTIAKTLGDMFPSKSWAAKHPSKPNPLDCQGERLDASISSTHGFLGDSSWKGAAMRVRCDADARPGYNSMKAHEYLEEPDVLLAKVKLFASLLKKSKNTLAYTGAGISRASGIDDYATRVVSQDRPKLGSPMDALPTTAHKMMTKLHKHNHLHYWIQQNHDGLPQKAGYPQHGLNEIHGAWYDPSNPVVKMEGQLRADLFQGLLDWEKKADLVLAFGTSLAGMNADRLVTSCGRKARSTAKGNAIGPVIVNLQQTACDDSAALRIFAPLDQVLAMVVQELGYKEEETEEEQHKFYSPDVPSSLDGDVWDVPYDAQGLKSETATTKFDLRVGAKHRITSGPYIGSEGEVTGINRQGHYKITFMVQIKKGAKFRAAWPMVLGSWWAEAAVKGSVPCLPIVTIEQAPAPDTQLPAETQECKESKEHVASTTSTISSHMRPSQDFLADFDGRPVVLSGLSMADGGAPPKNLLAEIVNRKK